MVYRFRFQARRPAASLIYSAKSYQVKVSGARKYHKVRSVVEENHLERRSLQAPLRILSLDGGGVRGLSSLLILKELMQKVEKLERDSGKFDRNYHEPLKPCRYFDLIGGTSTGGIIAILLGRLKLDVPTSIAIYTELSKVVFQRDRSLPLFGVRLPYRKSRFSATVLEDEIKKVLIGHGFAENEPMFDKALVNAFRKRGEEREEEDGYLTLEGMNDSEVDNENGSELELKTVLVLTILRRAFSGLFGARDQPLPNPKVPRNYGRSEKQRKRDDVENEQESDERGCHSFVVAVHKESLNTPKHFKTFDQHERELTIWQALRATTAAPTYFDPIALGNPETFYCDGGTGYNNPCSEVDRVAKSIWDKRTIGIVISIGTGLQKGSSPKRIKWLPNFLHVVKSLVPMATETERVHQDSYRRYDNGHTEYFRFDTHGVSDIGLEEWRKEELITIGTNKYMKQPSQIEKVKNCTECLVNLSAEPKTLEYPADKFYVGVNLDRTRDETYRDQQYPDIQPWRREELDIETGWPLGVDVLTEDNDHNQHISSSPFFRKPFKPSANSVELGITRTVLPLAQDLDQDGIPNECSIITFIRADTICIRQLVKGVPPGRYKAKFIVYFFDVKPGTGKDVMTSSTRAFAPSWPASRERVPVAASNEDSKAKFLDPESKQHARPSESAKILPPVDLTFNVGEPYDITTFMKRHVDVHITSDITPVLLKPDAVRLRVGQRQYRKNLGKGWVELGSDLPVDVSRSGTLGFVISKIWREGEFIGGWSFGGVRLVPDFEIEATEQAD